MTKHLKQACCKEKTNELRRIDSEFFEFTDMPVCFGTRLCGYRNRGWTYCHNLFFILEFIVQKYKVKVGGMKNARN